MGAPISKRTLFVFGGSLGAKSINEALVDDLEQLEAQEIQIIWQTGKPYFEHAKAAAKKYDDIRVFDFLREMEMAYAAADVIVSRAGALSIAELSIIGKPVVFVPYPHAAEDHQTYNAMALVQKQAARMIADKDVDGKLYDELMEVFSHEEMQIALSNNIKQFARRNADEVIANKILELIG